MITCEAGVDADAKQVCDDLGIDHYVLDLTKSFDEKVVNYFVEEYKHGRTPNPMYGVQQTYKNGSIDRFCS